MKYTSFCLSIALLLCVQVFCQPKGNLFIIGGGSKSDELMRTLVATVHLSPLDYIAVLPMATEEPDSALYYISQDFQKVCNNKVFGFNFTANNTYNASWLDSVKRAKLVYITGGDQSRFMNIALHTPVQHAIKEAYNKGATIAGTSAGAAMMTHYMITGNQLLGDTAYRNTFPKLWYGNLEIKEGLGLLDSAIIDMHFVARSRYNRLLTAVAMYPTLPCIGIDEGTAIIVHGNKATVAGASQVMVFRQPVHLQVLQNKEIKMDDLHVSIYTAGDTFMLR
jgi:cyanophycinase